MSAPPPLELELPRLIATEGPMPVARYMALCLSHPQHGYYMTRDPFGRAGDFTTAPEISQMFGELLGLWAAAVWQQMGSPSLIVLAELGPGRGTLMADALRAAKAVPGFREALSVHLVDLSPVLRERQRERLADTGMHPEWHAEVGGVPGGPLIVLANEFLDALPVNQAVKAVDGWHERVVGLGDDDRLAFGLQAAPIPRFETILPGHLRDPPLGAVYEWRSDGLVEEICTRIAHFGGAALFIDYGHIDSVVGDTLQAVRGHTYADPLDTPGETDLTAYVDYAALKRAGLGTRARAHGPITQRTFLRNLGIEARAARLKVSATPAQAEAIDQALARLIGTGPKDMGNLFKVIAFTDRPIASVPGFDT